MDFIGADSWPLVSWQKGRLSLFLLIRTSVHSRKGNPKICLFTILPLRTHSKILAVSIISGSLRIYP